MAKYRKEPIVVEAEVYYKGLEDGFDKDTYCQLHEMECQDSCGSCPHYKPYINILGGKYYISPGDYIVTDVKGEKYPCKPDIFKMTYELVEE